MRGHLKTISAQEQKYNIYKYMNEKTHKIYTRPDAAQRQLTRRRRRRHLNPSTTRKKEAVWVRIRICVQVS